MLRLDTTDGRRATGDGSSDIDSRRPYVLGGLANAPKSISVRAPANVLAPPLTPSLLLLLPPL